MVSSSFSLIFAQEWTDYNQHDPGITASAIPDWVDNSFRWYVDGAISQQELLTSVNWLLDNNYMHLSDKAANEIQVLRNELQDLREENNKLRSMLGSEASNLDDRLDTLTSIDKRSVYLKTDTTSRNHDEIMILLRPAPGYNIPPDGELVIFLKSPSGDGYDLFRGASSSSNDNGEFWFENLPPGDKSGEFWFEDLIPGHSHSGNSQQSCDIACLVYDPVCGVDGKTYSNSCFAMFFDVEVDYEGECVVCPVIMLLFVEQMV